MAMTVSKIYAIDRKACPNCGARRFFRCVNSLGASMVNQVHVERLEKK